MKAAWQRRRRFVAEIDKPNAELREKQG